MTAARLKDILYYSAVGPPLPPALAPVLFSLFRRGWRKGGRFEKSLGHSLRVRRSAEDRERTTDRRRNGMRSDGKARAARKRRGVNHDFGGILARDGMCFPSSSSFPSVTFIRSLQCQFFLFPVFSRLSFHVPNLVHPLYIYD